MSTPVYEQVGKFTRPIPVAEEEVDLSKKAHIVNVPMNYPVAVLLAGKGWTVHSPQDLVDGARHYGLKVEAICGYMWVPTARPSKHDVCEECMAVASRWISEDE